MLTYPSGVCQLRRKRRIKSGHESAFTGDVSPTHNMLCGLRIGLICHIPLQFFVKLRWRHVIFDLIQLLCERVQIVVDLLEETEERDY